MTIGEGAPADQYLCSLLYSLLNTVGAARESPSLNAQNDTPHTWYNAIRTTTSIVPAAVTTICYPATMPSIHFKGKATIENLHLAVPYRALIPDDAASRNGRADLHDNLIIHGDNLEALKALLPTFGGRVKCIYIDPPCNTGNEDWAYNDNFNGPMFEEWLGKHVNKEDMTRHDKWLCMMLPRLRLLRELLADDGAIFVSIDDNEAHRLRMLLDEVFATPKPTRLIQSSRKRRPSRKSARPPPSRTPTTSTSHRSCGTGAKAAGES